MDNKKLKLNGSVDAVRGRTPAEFYRKLISAQKRNIKSLSILVFVNFLIAGLGFLTQLQIANTLGKESFGLIAFGMAVATYGAVIIRFGLDKTLVRDLIHFPDRYTATVKASLILRFALLGVFAATILSWKMLSPGADDISWGVVLIIIANAAMSMDLQAVYDSWHKMSLHAMFNLAQKGVYFSLIWIILLVNPSLLSVLWVGVATTISVIIYLSQQYAWALKRMPASNVSSGGARMAVELARGNIVIWISALAGLSFGTLNQLMLKYYHGSAELGGYAAAWMMVTVATILLTQVARIGNPATARITSVQGSVKLRISFLLKYTSAMLLVAFPIAMVAIAEPEWVIESLFKPEFVSSAPVLRVLGLYMLVFATGLVAAQYLVSARQEKAYMQCVLIGSACGIILCILLIPSTAGAGAAWALLLSHGLTIILYWARIAVVLKKAI